MLRFGLVGLGTHSRWAVVPAIEAAHGCELVAIAEIVPEHLETLDASSVAKYSDYAEMLAREDLDVVYVATPADVHCAPTVAALEAGCHVVCEKPMAINEDECCRMLVAADAAGKMLVIDFESRQAPAHQQVRSWIAAGHIGAVRAVHIHAMWDGHKSFGDLAARRKAFLMRTGSLDCGIHMLDLVRFYCGGGEWRDVRALGAWFGEDVTCAPHIAIMARLTPGIMVTLEDSLAYGAYMHERHQHHTKAILGEKGVIALDRDEEGREVFRLVSDSLSATCPLASEGHGSAIAKVLEDMVPVITDGAPVPPSLATGHDGLMAQIVVDAANRSAIENGDTCAAP